MNCLYNFLINKFNLKKKYQIDGYTACYRTPHIPGPYNASLLRYT